jgi:hypothetical protein
MEGFSTPRSFDEAESYIRLVLAAIAVIPLDLSPQFVQAQSTKGTSTTTAAVPLTSCRNRNDQFFTALPKVINIVVVDKDRYWLKIESKQGANRGIVRENPWRAGQRDSLRR